MRFAILVILCIVLLFEGLLFVLFTTPGNDLLLPYINSYLQHKVPQAKVVLKKIRLKPNTIGMVAELNDAINIRAKGDIDLLSRNFDINYTIDTEEIKMPTLTIKEHITVKGNAKGHPEEMRIEGRGVAFKSAIRYGVSLIKQNPQNINIDIKDADLQSLLVVAGQKPYATGRLSLHANMPNFAPLNPQIDAVFGIKNGAFNSKYIAKDFNITLPAHTTYQTDFVVKTENRRITFDGNFNSTLANLALKKGRYRLLGNALDTEYHLVIPKLEKLAGITKASLKGDFVMNGTVSLKNNLPAVTGSTKSFGGTIDFNYSADTLIATLKKVHNATLLYKLGQPKYLSGLTTAHVKLTSLKNLTGTFTLQSSGNTNRNALKKSFDLDLGSKFTFTAMTKGHIQKQQVAASLSAKTSMAHLKSSRIHFDIPKATLGADYTLSIPDMGKLQPLTGKRFIGDMLINGTIKKRKTLAVTGHGKEFGGSIDFTLIDKHLQADVTGATVSKVMHMLDYPQVLEAISKAKVNYNTQTASGTLHATLDNARILPNKLTALLKQFKIIDLSRERFNNSTFDAKITKKLIDFTLDARNKNNYLLVKHGKLIKKTDAIQANIEMKFRGKDLQATLRGTTKHPKVSLDGSKYLENKLKEKVLKSKAAKKLKKSLKKKLEGKTGSKIKDLVKGLF